MATKRKSSPVTTPPLVPAEKKPSEMDPAEWFADVTKRDDVKEILSRLAK